MIETGSAADAECIAEALDRFESEAARAGGGGWAVTVSRPDLRLVCVLGSLERCLTDSGIASVKVTIDDRTYLMEAGARPDAPTAAARTSLAVDDEADRRGVQRLETALSSA